MTIRNFEKVDKFLYRSGKLKPVDILTLSEKGIKKIISLDEELGADISEACKKLHIKHLILPIDIYDNKSVRNIINDDLLSNIQDDGPTLVHCRAGKDRTGLVCAVYSLLTGKSMKAVKSKLFYFGFGIGLPAKTKEYYLKVINEVGKLDHSKIKDKLNNDSLVQLSRSYEDSDPEHGFLDQSMMESFAPYLDYTRQYPYDISYPDILQNDYSRESYERNRNKKNPETQQTSENAEMPTSVMYYSDINNTGLLPIDVTGLFYD